MEDHFYILLTGICICHSVANLQFLMCQQPLWVMNSFYRMHIHKTGIKTHTKMHRHKHKTLRAVPNKTLADANRAVYKLDTKGHHIWWQNKETCFRPFHFYKLNLLFTFWIVIPKEKKDSLSWQKMSIFLSQTQSSFLFFLWKDKALFTAIHKVLNPHLTLVVFSKMELFLYKRQESNKRKKSTSRFHKTAF